MSSMFSWDFAIGHFPELLKVVPVTLLIAVVSMLLGLVFGLLIALCRIYRVPVLNKLAALYVSFIRGTPMLVQLYVFLYGVPALLEALNNKWGWNLSSDNISPLIFALTAYTINSAAYQSEVVRAALNAIDMSQMEAAYSVGMTTTQSLVRIILPQALVVALPNLANIFIGLIKATSLAFAVKVIDIMAVAKIVSAEGYRFMEMYLGAAIIYWVICFALERLFAVMEKKLRRYESKMV